MSKEEEGAEDSSVKVKGAATGIRRLSYGSKGRREEEMEEREQRLRRREGLGAQRRRVGNVEAGITK